MTTIAHSKTRFDTRLSIELKQLLERAAELGGFRSLSDFVLSTAQKRATEIIEARETVLASQRDSAVFFDAVNAAVAPNAALLSAAKEYDAQLPGE